MTDGPLLRLLEMVKRELGADDARVEVGGKEPSSDLAISVQLSESRRVVALFEERKPSIDARSRLLSLVEAFSGTATPEANQRKRPPGALTQALLNEQLGMLAERLNALRVLIVDGASPVIWGSSDPFQRTRDGVDDALRTARVVASAKEEGLDFAELLAAGLEQAGGMLAKSDAGRGLIGTILREIDLLHAERIVRDADEWRAVVLASIAIAQLRQHPPLQAAQPRARRVTHEEDFGALAKPFACSYWLVSVFDRPFSELRVEGTIVRVLPRIERLVLALPPVDPPPAKGRVVRLHTSK